MLRRNFKSLLCILLSLNLAGCRTKDEAIIVVGMMLIVTFLGYWLASVAFPKIQSSSPVRSFVKRFKRFISWIALTLMTGCVIMAAVSFFMFDGVKILLTGVFTLGIVGSWYLKRWADQPEHKEHPLELKMVFGVITFIVAMLWLIIFGAEVLRL